MEKNKKIKNATKNTFESILFKSKMEKSCYVTLLQNGFSPQYEAITFTLWEGFKPIVPFYDQETKKQRDSRDPNSRLLLRKKDNKLIGIKYTPDFFIRYNDLDVYIEVKGIENDVFYIKKKMFIKYLNDKFIELGKKSIYFEIYTKTQLLQAIDIIKNYTDYSKL